MVEKIQAIRGMNDYLPHDTKIWQLLEDKIKTCLGAYGYSEIRFPLLEQTDLFKRSIGDVTDIVEKEMYTFCDLNGDSLSLRPEGTAGCLRACIQHGLLYNQQQKLWYLGPMFRHERPQKGRYRQFYQLGVEVLGIDSVAIECELLLLCQRLWQMLLFLPAVTLEINTIGQHEERAQYKQQLVDYFKLHESSLDEDSKRRLVSNPLRILDSKNKDMSELIVNAPRLLDTLGKESRARFDKLCEGLDILGVSYKINPLLVRGLDYYSHLVFEWVTPHLGAQSTICAGGRYDALVAQLGGQPTQALGFAIGMERVLLLLETMGISLDNKSPKTLFLMSTSEQGVLRLLALAEQLHTVNPALQLITNTVPLSLKSQFKKADKSGADYAVIIAEDELAKGAVSVKNLRVSEPQLMLTSEDFISMFDSKAP